MTDDVIIYHNPDCRTSRDTLGLIRNAGIEPQVIEYLKTPPSRRLLKSLTERMGVSVREVVRVKGTPYHELGLDDPKLTDDQLPDQPPDCRDGLRRKAVPSVRDGARFVADAAAGRVSQRGRGACCQ